MFLNFRARCSQQTFEQPKAQFLSSHLEIFAGSRFRFQDQAITMSGWNSFAPPTTAASGGFSFGTPSGTNTSQANTTFDATTGLNGTTVIFQPVTGSDTIMSWGVCKNISTRHQVSCFI